MIYPNGRIITNPDGKKYFLPEDAIIWDDVNNKAEIDRSRLVLLELHEARFELFATESSHPEFCNEQMCDEILLEWAKQNHPEYVGYRILKERIAELEANNGNI